MRRMFLIFSLFLLLGPVFVNAETLHVPEDYPTIQAAIDAAQPGDTVFVVAGRYKENLLIHKAIQLVGEGRTVVWIEAEDAIESAVSIDLAGGTASVEGVAITGGLDGLLVAVGSTGNVAVRQALIVGNDYGITAFGSGAVSVERCLVVDSASIGIQASVARIQVIDTEISRGRVGILLFGGGRHTVTDCLIGLCTYGVDTYTGTCGWPSGENAFIGTVDGQRNRVFGIQTDLCPEYPDSVWPEGFVDVAWREAVAEIAAAYEQGVREGNAQDYTAACETYSRGLSLLASAGVSFPLLEAYVLQNLANIHVRLGWYNEALANHEAARTKFVERGLDVNVANVDQNIGVIYQEQGRYEEALAKYEATRTVFKEQGLNVNVAIVDQSIGAVYRNLGRYEEALAKYQAARTAFAELAMDVNVAEVDQNIGNIYVDLGWYEAALTEFEAARAVFVEQRMDVNVAKVDQSIGAVYENLGRYEEALAKYETARAVYAAQGMDVAVAEVNQNIAVVYTNLGWYNEALSVYRAVRVVFASHGMDVDTATVDQNIAIVYVTLGRYDEALVTYEAARAVFVEQGLAARAAAVDQNIANVYARLGRYDEALATYEAARAVFTEQEVDTSAATVDVNVGSICSHLGWYEAALERYEAARAVFVGQGMDVRVAQVDQNAASVYIDLGQYDEALVRLESARKAFAERGMDLAVGGIDQNIGVVYASLRRYGEALAKYEAAREVYVRQGMDIDAAEVDLNISNIYVALGRREEALAVYKAILQLLDQTTPSAGTSFSYPGMRWEILANIGIVYEGLDECENARESYEDAIAVIESIRSGLASEEIKLAWQECTKYVHERLIELLYDFGETSASLPIAERCRARTFLDLIAAGPVGTLKNVAEEGIRAGVVDASVIESDLAEVIAALPPDTAALEYFVTDEATYLWLVRDGSPSDPIRIEVDRSDLRDQVLALRTTIETTSTGLSELTDETTLTMSRDLYRLLIAPVEDQLEGIEHLVIVPSGPLYYLPFCALMSCPACEGADLLGGEYLIERYSVSYVPSLTMLKYAWAAADEVQTDSLFLALADPDSGDAGIPRLPEAQDEATAAAELFDPNEVYVNAEATEEVIAARAWEADQILLATHGSFNPLNPMFSYLLLSPTDESDGRLYTHEIFGLDLHTDLVTLSACETLLPALEDAEEQVLAIRGEDEGEDVELTQELLETLTAGDEIVGLTRALLYAGTATVVSTLWQVTSLPTQTLMIAFYTHLVSGLDKAQALRQAQLDIMASYPHPRYWAAFELMGEWR